MSEGGTIAAGATAFFRSPTHSWVLGTVESMDAKDTYTCKTRADTTNGVEIETVSKLKRDEVFVITNLGLLDEKPDDLLMLTLLHDSTLMHALNQRYFKNIIYTDIGPIVVAFNPFNFNIPWYKDDMMVHYTQEDYPIRKNKPHSWAVAHNTYYEMIDRKQNQCVLVSGESGAGKTEAVKIVMKYLSAISVKKSQNEGLRKETELVGKKLLQASPILEGFGNAKTVRNDNSSRFGKFMKVQFKNACLVGAYTIKYLLEKSRIVTAGPGERCYHSFYYLCAGKDAGKFRVGNAGTYRSLKAGNCITVDGVDDSADYNECNEAFKDVGINDDEKEEIWKTVGGVLNLLNVEFKPAGGGDSSEVDGKWKDSLMTAAALWQVDGEKLHDELLRTVHEARGEKFVKNHTVTAAVDTRDSLVKAVYDELFDWLVSKLNVTASVDDFDNFIGLLDIFGFEDFKVNSFEQLCINLANETLQHHYNTYIFNKDIEECRAEGVDVTAIVFPDNTPCLKLITDKMGIIALLDEECALGKGSDEGFLAKVIENCGKHEFFEKDRLAKTSFKVKHYAGDVSYEIAGFLDKNRDTLKDDMKRLMRSSGSSLIGGLLPEPVDKSGKKITVGGFFKNQLGELMDLINSTNPHWIRCIKPHPAKKPLMWHGVNVFTQLSSSGIIGTVKVRKAGFPIRMYHSDFLKRFRILKPGPVDDQKSKCEEICAAMKMDRKRIQVGTTRVFMKNEEYWLLENAISTVAGKYVMAMQAYSRHMHAKVILGEKDFEKNKASILEGVRKTMMLQIEEQRGRRQVEADSKVAFAQTFMPEVEALESAGRQHIAKQWEEELKARVEKDGAELRRLEQELRERRKRLHQQQEEDRNRMVAREESGREEIVGGEESEWQAIAVAATAEQEARDRCRADEKRGRLSIDEEENNMWVYIIEEERQSFKFWKDREQNRLASEWKDLIEGVYAVQAERKAAAVAQEKYRYDSRRREMAEQRRQQYLADQIPRTNSEAERQAFAKNAVTQREQLHHKRESEADRQVDKLRVRKELLMGPEAARQQKIHRIRQEQALVEHQRRHATQDGLHDALSSRAYPSGRSPLHTHADPPPQYLFSQTSKSTAETIMAARTPTPAIGGGNGAHSPTRGSGGAYSPTYAVAEYGGGPEMEPLFSPVRTRAAAGMDADGRAVQPMLPQPNPVSPPKLGKF